ncbi:MAG: hypothetical protein ACR2MF_06620 [Chthoniobacterales bacterium]
MKRVADILLLSGVFLVGCGTARNVAVSSFRVIDTPARYVRQRIDSPEQARVNAETAASSDAVLYPGRPIEPSANPAPQPQRRRTTTTSRQSEAVPRSTPRPSQSAANDTTKPPPTTSQRTTTSSTTAAQIPTGKPVPGKPGYVFSPFDPSGGYVDVNGYSSGQKVKDPYSGKIFLVP